MFGSSFRRVLLPAAAVAVVCAAVGITAAMAAPSGSHASRGGWASGAGTHMPKARIGMHGHGTAGHAFPGMGGHGFRRFPGVGGQMGGVLATAMTAVHGDVTVLDHARTAYITATFDRGTVSSVSGTQLAITEGTTAVPYTTVTDTVPTGATVILDGKTASLSSLQSGDVVIVVSDSDATHVYAFDKSGPGAPGSSPFGAHRP